MTQERSVLLNDRRARVVQLCGFMVDDTKERKVETISLAKEIEPLWMRRLLGRN